MANSYVYYTIKEGDNLTKIAEKFNTSVSYLQTLNGFTNPDIIKAGAVMKVGIKSDGDASSTNPSQYAKVTNFGLMIGSTRDVFAQWEWHDPHTDHYEILWMYATGVSIGFIGSRTTTNETQATWTAPENATHVTFQVKPISKTYKNNGSDQEYHYFTSGWTSKVRYYFSSNPPEKPTGLTVKIENEYTLVASLDNLSINADEIEFRVIKNNTKTFATGKATITKNYAEWSCTIDAGHVYKVQCRALRTDHDDTLHSDWTDYSENVMTVPSPPKQIVDLRRIGEDNKDVYISWSKVESAEQYEVEYTTNYHDFDSSTSTPLRHTVDAPLSHAEIRELAIGDEWYFRVRAKNSVGASKWTETKSIAVGTKPTSPTTWSSVTATEVGEPVTLYWVHNSEDESEERGAELVLNINGRLTTLIFDWSSMTISSNINGTVSTYNIYPGDAYHEENGISWFVLTGNYYTGDSVINWKVRTLGVIDYYGDWSIERTIKAHVPPVVSIDMWSGATLAEYPLRATIESGPTTQTPLGYHVSIKPQWSYEDYDRMGNPVHVTKGSAIYSKYIESSNHQIDLKLTPGDVNLSNGVRYTLEVKVTMDTGLSKSATATFLTRLDEGVEYYPNAELMYDKERYSMHISPYCKDENDNLISGVTLSVYRHNFDGSFTEIAANRRNNNTFVTDPHPSLDFARYRIVATNEDSGAMGVYDIPAFEIGEGAVLIQWDEEWSPFEITDEPVDEPPAWAGSLLRLPFNVDISESNSPDTVLVNYIGREHPTSYYGTHIGQALTCNTVVEHTDKETIYALRRLARWMGDVYIREPSGNGYWANVKVKFDTKHRELLIPVTIDITRVEGGI